MPGPQATAGLPFCFDVAMDALTDSEIQTAIGGLPGWEYDGEAITKTFGWGSFREAIDFVNDVADLAEDENHHPDLEIYFDEVVVSFRTHSADAVTDSDVRMAREVEALASDYEDEEFEDLEEYVDLEEDEEVDDEED